MPTAKPIVIKETPKKVANKTPTNALIVNGQKKHFLVEQMDYHDIQKL